MTVHMDYARYANQGALGATAAHEGTGVSPRETCTSATDITSVVRLWVVRSDPAQQS
jgi:hypothetical protein